MTRGFNCATFPLTMPLAFLKKKPVPEPAHDPVQIPSLAQAEIAAAYRGERIGGDLYDFVRVSPHLVLFGLLDVAGRRTENACIVATAQQTFRGRGHELFSADDINEADAMMALSLELNRAIMECAHGVCSCPAFIGCFNERMGTVCYSNAGHTPALLRDKLGVTRLPATGLPLGLFSHVTHDAPTVALEPGAVLVLVSRGVTEMRYDGGEFGLDRVANILSRANITTAEQLCAKILNSVEGGKNRRPQNDITAMVLLRARSEKAHA
ncbi:MAG TPA: SpoIIE family protein phosphatase [Terriglobales bacterium]|nr:SpoIIE family protein phosphatase [Terriglobales bacterium]